jgi:peptidoglycan/xylan/chitin deacetylase (PgdA/CDA1 family)
MLEKNKLRYIYIYVTTSILIILIFGVYAVSTYSNSRSEAILSITFDDGLLTQYENAFPLMQKYNLTGTLYYTINATRFYELEGRELMSVENVIEMYDAGWEIGAHSVNHPRLDRLSSEDLEFELKYPIEFFEGYGIEIKTLAYPYWSVNDDVIEKVKKLYLSGNIYFDKVPNNIKKDLDFYRLKSIGIEDKHSPEQVCEWVEKAKNRGQWIILVFHSVEEEKTRQWDTSIKDFEGMLKCINEIGIKVKNVDEVVLEMKS